MALFQDPTIDSHWEVAKLVWGAEADKDRKRFRNMAKAIANGWNYGQSIGSITDNTGVPEADASRFDASMRAQFPILYQWRQDVESEAGIRDFLDNGVGRPMRPDKYRGHTQGPALMGQGLARDLMGECILRLPLEVVPMLRCFVHDEIVFSVPRDQAEDVKAVVLDAMSFEHKDVPVTASCEGFGETWGGVYE